eukprot:COSAG02_NODE_17488_length_999_cov_87.947778_2_plen_178_part_00
MLSIRPVDVLLLQTPGRGPGGGQKERPGLSTGSWYGCLKRDGPKAKPIKIPAECVVPIVPVSSPTWRRRENDVAIPTPEPEPEPEQELHPDLFVLALSTLQLTTLPKQSDLTQPLLDAAAGVVVCCDLRNNRLTSPGADILGTLPDLETIDLSLNCIENDDKLPSLPRLRYLDLSTW